MWIKGGDNPPLFCCTYTLPECHTLKVTLTSLSSCNPGSVIKGRGESWKLLKGITWQLLYLKSCWKFCLFVCLFVCLFFTVEKVTSLFWNGLDCTVSSILIAISDQRKQRKEFDLPDKGRRVVVVGRFLGLFQSVMIVSLTQFFSEIKNKS